MAQQEKIRNNSIKVLSVVWYKVLPANYGGQKAVALFNEHMGRLLPMVCICSRNNEGAETSYVCYKRLPACKTQFLNPFAWRQIYITAKKEKATHLVLEFPYHGIAGFICKRWLGIKLIVNTHNIEFLRFKEAGKWWWRLLYHFEKWTLKNADLIFFKTGKDRAAAQKSFGLKERSCSTIPYGAEKKTIDKNAARNMIRRRHGIAAGEHILLFAGTLDYAPNAAALVSIKEQIIPILNKGDLKYKILVCGRNRNKKFQSLNLLGGENLVIAAEVDDIENYFAAATVFISPVQSGGGIQTKVIDALSYDLNVVCFASQCAGIGNAGTKLFSVEDGDWKGFVTSIKKAVNNNAHTPPAFFETYNWRSIASKAFQQISSI